MAGENIDGLPASIETLAKQGILGFPIAVWVAAAVLAFTATIITQTPLGRQLFAVGSSSYSAKMAGLSTTRLKIFVFAYTGFLTALATIVDVPRLPKMKLELDPDSSCWLSRAWSLVACRFRAAVVESRGSCWPSC